MIGWMLISFFVGLFVGVNLGILGVVWVALEDPQWFKEVFYRGDN